MNRRTLRELVRRHRRRNPAVTTDWVQARRDRGAVLPLVLVLIVVGALIVIPVTAYTVSVLRANRVEEAKTRNVEAAKGAIRVALGAPGQLFGNEKVANAGCPGDISSLIPSTGVMDETPVSITCTPVDELSANEIFGLEVPFGTAQLQIAPDPANFPNFSGVPATSGAAPPYPDSATTSPAWAWWQDYQWVNPSDPADTKDIEIPSLPAFSGVERTVFPRNMNGSFACHVFLPGRYTTPVVIDESYTYDNFYFASGVYYFEAPVTISGDVNVVVGQGLADFGVSNDCADDVQVGANVIVPSGTVYGIDGNSGGATWVFGDDGRLVISEAGGSPTVRFNQRYATADRGAWINVMSVNGDWSYGNGDSTDDDDFEDPVGNHTATNVNWVPRSTVLSGAAEIALDASGAPYRPSAPSLTDEARRPDAPTAVSGVAVIREVAGADDGAVIVSFDGVEGDETNGAIIDDYEVGIADTAAAMPTPTCSVSSGTLWPTYEGTGGPDPWGTTTAIGENTGDPDGYSCLITRLAEDDSVFVSARARNDAGWSNWSVPVEVDVPATSPTALPPAAVSDTSITFENYGVDGALVSWDASLDSSRAPVQSYEVTVYQVSDVQVDAVTPDTGDEIGGEPVTITGSGFQSSPPTAVTFGGLAALFTVDSDTSISATTPAHAPGPVDVVVEFDDVGTDPVTFTYTQSATAGDPVITAINPANGPEAGGQSATITGTDLAGATQVLFGTSPASITTNDPGQVIVTTPPGTGTVPVTVTTGAGTSSPVAYTYDPPPSAPPTLTAITPNNGPGGGGNTVTLTGTGLSAATVVTFGGTAGSNLVILSDTEATIDVPAHPTGNTVVDVVVTSPAGTSAPPLDYAYGAPPTPPPDIDTISPSTGSTAGGLTVNLNGEYFTAASDVLFGSTAATSFTVVDDGRITAVSPPHAAGSVDVTVVTPAGTSNAVPFLYTTNVQTPQPVSCDAVAPSYICDDPDFQACAAPVIVRTGLFSYGFSCDAPICFNGDVQALAGGVWSCADSMCDLDERPRYLGDGNWGCENFPFSLQFSCAFGGQTPIYAFGRSWCYNPGGGFANPGRVGGLSPSAEYLASRLRAPVGVETEVDTCTAQPKLGQGSDEDLEWTAITQCIIDPLPPLPAGSSYRVEVTAISSTGATSSNTSFGAPTGTGVLDDIPQRVWFPFYEQSIISIDASGGGGDQTVVEIPGYISVPMGRVSIANPGGDAVRLTGGMLAGRIVIDDPRDPLPMGYVPSVVMQRTVELTATAGNIESVARVKINSDTSYGVLRWITQ